MDENKEKEMKIKESETIDKYLDLAYRADKSVAYEGDVMVIPIITGTLGIIPKDFDKRLEELEIRRIKTIQIIVLLKLARILRRVLGTLRRLVVT